MEVRCRSFSLSKVSKECSHLIHNCSVSALPAGLRLETSVKIDKKKTELYFSSPKKKFLTAKRIARVPGETTERALSKRIELLNFGLFLWINCPPGFRQSPAYGCWEMNRKLTKLKSLRILPIPECHGWQCPANRKRRQPNRTGK